MTEHGSTGALAFPDSGLLPAIVQSVEDGTVLMLGWMDHAALRRTLTEGRVTFFSRSRRRLWTKGETSGHHLDVVEVRTDCDRDTILVRARARGPTCHEGTRSCFDAGPRLFPEADPEPESATGAKPGPPAPEPDLGAVLAELFAMVERRDRERPEGSYTVRLLEGGVAEAAQKVGEEAIETALAAVAETGSGRLAEESADLLYHLLVLWRAAGTEPADVARALQGRRGRRGDA